MFNEIIYGKVQRVTTIFAITWVVVSFSFDILFRTVEQIDFRSPLSVMVAFVFFKVMIYYNRKDIF